MPAHQITYTLSGNQFEAKQTQAWTSKDDKWFVVSYSAEPSAYFNPRTAQNILDSVLLRTAKAVDRNHGCLVGNMFQQVHSSSFQISDIYKFVLLEEFIILLSDLSYQKLIMMTVITELSSIEASHNEYYLG